MPASPKLSIICATKDLLAAGRADSFRKMIQSIEDGAPEPVEIIVVDSASTDGTLDVIERCRSTRHRYHLISEPDTGIYDAYQKGVDAATGTWLNFMNSDDYFADGALDAFFAVAGAQVDIIFGDAIYDHGNAHGYVKGKLRNFLLGMTICTQSMFFRKKSIQGLGGFQTQYKIAGDYDLVLRGIVSSWKFKKTRQNIVIFKMGGAASQNTFLASKETKKIWRENLLSFSSLSDEKLDEIISKQRISLSIAWKVLIANQSWLLSYLAIRMIIRGLTS